MNNTAIRVDRLGKRYCLGQIHSNLLSEKIGNGLRSFYDRIRSRNSSVLSSNGSRQKDFWALKDVSFEIEPGEVVGIIGRNGAGKSTLLKILSRVTEPTEGQVEMYGRVGSLLEVGTGFHPELTGRENIFLNGAILGMKKAEIRRKFDEIVVFAEVDKFIDTPVKRYSSGMYVRLAFAVAAHLEPEILVVDEVLAVGDAEFQKKCLGKMEEVGKEGRTVLFVSHNVDAVLRLCKSAILLKGGSVQIRGSSEQVTGVYLKEQVGVTSAKQWNICTAPVNAAVRLMEVYAHRSDGSPCDSFDVTEPVGITMKYDVLEPGHFLTPACNFYNDRGVNIFDSHDTSQECRTTRKSMGRYESTVWIPANFLSEGVVTVGAAIITPDPFLVHLHEKEVIAFNMADSLRKNSARGEYKGTMPGIIRPLLRWHTRARNQT